MRRSFTWMSIKVFILSALLLLPELPAAYAFAANTQDSEPVTLRVVAVNPSTEKAQSVPVRIDLPSELKPDDVIDRGGLDLEFDDNRSIYYMKKDSVELAPQEMKTFEVKVRDVWQIPDAELKQLRDYVTLLMKKLEKSEYAETGKQIHDSVTGALDQIISVQTDESLSRKTKIGAYRLNRQSIAQIKDEMARMEKLLTFTGGPPVPELLQESKLKSDMPSTKTTWLIILMIVVFMGLMGGLFFLTWHQKARAKEDLTEVKQFVFPEEQGGASQGNAGTPPEKPKVA